MWKGKRQYLIYVSMFFVEIGKNIFLLTFISEFRNLKFPELENWELKFPELGNLGTWELV